MICTIEEYLSLANSKNTEDNKKTIHEELSLDVILTIIHEYPNRKSWLVHNKHIPLEILKKLSTDDDIDVRFTIAMKKKCNHEIFRTLLHDPDYSVRMAVVRNNKLPLDLLEKMRYDKETEISQEAIYALEMRSRK